MERYPNGSIGLNVPEVAAVAMGMKMLPEYITSAPLAERLENAAEAHYQSASEGEALSKRHQAATTYGAGHTESGDQLVQETLVAAGLKDAHTIIPECEADPLADFLVELTELDRDKLLKRLQKYDKRKNVSVKEQKKHLSGMLVWMKIILDQIYPEE